MWRWKIITKKRRRFSKKTTFGKHNIIPLFLSLKVIFASHSFANLFSNKELSKHDTLLLLIHKILLMMLCVQKIFFLFCSMYTNVAMEYWSSGGRTVNCGHHHIQKKTNERDIGTYHINFRCFSCINDAHIDPFVIIIIIIILCIEILRAFEANCSWQNNIMCELYRERRDEMNLFQIFDIVWMNISLCVNRFNENLCIYGSLLHTKKKSCNRHTIFGVF